MSKATPVLCPNCGAYVTDAENLTQMVMPVGGLKCPKCGQQAVHSNEPVWSSNQTGEVNNNNI